MLPNNGSRLLSITATRSRVEGSKGTIACFPHYRLTREGKGREKRVDQRHCRAVNISLAYSYDLPFDAKWYSNISQYNAEVQVGHFARIAGHCLLFNPGFNGVISDELTILWAVPSSSWMHFGCFGGIQRAAPEKTIHLTTPRQEQFQTKTAKKTFIIPWKLVFLSCLGAVSLGNAFPLFYIQKQAQETAKQARKHEN